MFSRILINCIINPWYDEELLRLRHLKNSNYKRSVRTGLPEDKEMYDYYNKLFNDYNDEKLIDYFKDKSVNVFRNSKKFWEYYSSRINIKSDKTSSNPISHVRFDGKMNENKDELCNVFNRFFTSISSSSNSIFEECSVFIEKNLVDKELNEFKFNFTSANELNELLASLPSSRAPGICGLPTKIIKSSSVKLKTVIAYLFNYSIMSCTIPDDSKTAIVLPLYKNKGSNDDLNNYRAISILPFI